MKTAVICSLFLSVLYTYSPRHGCWQSVPSDTHTAGSPSSIPVRQDWNRCEHAEISLSRTYSHLAQPRVSCPPRNDLDFIWGLFSLVFTLSQVNIPLLKLFSSFVFYPETRHGGANNMGATYNNTKQSKCLSNNQQMNAFPSWCCSGFGKDVMCFPTLTFIWTEVSLNSSPLYLWCISGVLPCAQSLHM